MRLVGYRSKIINSRDVSTEVWVEKYLSKNIINTLDSVGTCVVESLTFENIMTTCLKHVKFMKAELIKPVFAQWSRK